MLRRKISESNEKLKIKLEEQDIRNFEAPSHYYDAILAFNSLVFLKKSEFLNVIAKIKKCLAVDGLVFISLFTEEDPSFSSFAKNKKPIEPNTFLNERTGEYWQFMKKGELGEVFSDFKTLFYEEKIVHDTRPTPHDHGIVFYVGKKKARNN
jgi:cyclopropane fatty-acyl-phospholipid synthase-like methyltransferase